MMSVVRGGWVGGGCVTGNWPRYFTGATAHATIFAAALGRIQSIQQPAVQCASKTVPLCLSAGNQGHDMAPEPANVAQMTFDSAARNLHVKRLCNSVIEVS
jgi:hypothetical protein